MKGGLIKMSDATLTLLETVLSLVFGIGGAMLIPRIKELSTKKIGTTNTDMLLTWADTVVKMAEQKLGARAGQAKYSLALAALQGFSDRNNLKVDQESLEAAIEAAVLQLKTNKLSDT